MAMEKQYCVRDAHHRPITAIGYNTYRREIVIGCEDGIVKTFEADTGRQSHIYTEHRGMVTCFLYWPTCRILFSCANDSCLITYGTSGTIVDKIQMPQTIYCMEINYRKGHLIVGVIEGIRVYELDETKSKGHYIHLKCVHYAREHDDLVRAIVCIDGRVYSGGYDQRLIIYDSSYTKTMEPVTIVENAHEAGINCLIVVKDMENTWCVVVIVTGSFDKTVKVWFPDGKMVFKFDTFIATVTGLCYVPQNKTIWAAGGFNYAAMYDPKSGDNVAEFIGTFGYLDDDCLYHLQLMKYCPEIAAVIGTTNRRHIFVWKYSVASCISALKTRNQVECLCYTKKDPILLFSGDSQGSLIKWERLQSNFFMYSQEVFPLPEIKPAKQEEVMDEDAMIARAKRAEENMRRRVQKEFTSEYAYERPEMPNATVESHEHEPIAMLRCVFVEELDMLIGACENKSIFVWAFDEEAVDALHNMEVPDEEKEIIFDYSVLLDSESDLLRSFKIKAEDENVTNRVAGFLCKHIMTGHTNYVSALAVVPPGERYDRCLLISGGWDCRIVVWDPVDGVEVTAFRNKILRPHMEHVELACDGVITDLAYLSSRNEFAYSSADKMVYIRQFSIHGVDMTLLNTLQGHTAEVTSVVFNHALNSWVTGSEDASIRVWKVDGMNECEHVLNTGGSVQCLCTDRNCGAIVAGVLDTIKVYDAINLQMVQANVGHADLVKNIIHVIERGQYISSGGDKTIRIWNAWKPPRPRRKTSKELQREEIQKQLKALADAEAEAAAAALAEGKPPPRRRGTRKSEFLPKMFQSKATGVPLPEPRQKEVDEQHSKLEAITRGEDGITRSQEKELERKQLIRQ